MLTVRHGKVESLEKCSKSMPSTCPISAPISSRQSPPSLRASHPFPSRMACLSCAGTARTLIWLEFLAAALAQIMPGTMP